MFSPSYTRLQLVLAIVIQVGGTGRLLDPPSRSSMWRFGFPTPVNYNDNTLNCGGLYMQWYINEGKCGVCGDPWNAVLPRNNEGGGLYGKGIITRTYNVGQVIYVSVEITANHNGWFEFRLCPHNDPSTSVSQDCLNQYLLQFANSSETRYHIGTSTGLINLWVKLPADVTCTQCVFQWKWHTGNSYGTDENGSCIGCGQAQEEFYGCSDIAIIGSNSSFLTSQLTSVQTPDPSQKETITSIVYSPLQITSVYTVLLSFNSESEEVTKSTNTKCRAINEWAGVPLLDNYCSSQCLVGNCPSPYCFCFDLISFTTTPSLWSTVLSEIQGSTMPNTLSVATDTTPYPVKCYAINGWQGVETLDLWCSENCLAGPCPQEFCQCDVVPISRIQETSKTIDTTMSTFVVSTSLSLGTTVHLHQCHAVAQWAGQPQLDQWCFETCSRKECDLHICVCDPVDLSADVPLIICHAINGWKGDPALDDWCDTNCNTGLCPQEYCACGTESFASTTASSNNQLFKSSVSSGLAIPFSQPECHAINAWLGVPELDLWCRQRCGADDCPSSICLCGH